MPKSKSKPVTEKGATAVVAKASPKPSTKACPVCVKANGNINCHGCGRVLITPQAGMVKGAGGERMPEVYAKVFGPAILGAGGAYLESVTHTHIVRVNVLGFVHYFCRYCVDGGAHADSKL